MNAFANTKRYGPENVRRCCGLVTSPLMKKILDPENIDFRCWRYCRTYSLCELRALQTRVAFVAEHFLEVHTF